MSFIAEVSRHIAQLVGSARSTTLTVVFRSTMRRGTIEDLVLPIFEEALKDRIDLVELVYNPEFLRESVAIQDFFNPPKIVIGTKGGERCAALTQKRDREFVTGVLTIGYPLARDNNPFARILPRTPQGYCNRSKSGELR